MCDFTNDPNKIVTLLEDVQSTVQHLQTEFFDLSSVFEEVYDNIILFRLCLTNLSSMIDEIPLISS